MSDATAVTTRRVFKTGATRIVEDDSTAGLPIDQVKPILARTFPEITNATVRETPMDDGRLLVEFLPQPGRKG